MGLLKPAAADWRPRPDGAVRREYEGELGTIHYKRRHHVRRSRNRLMTAKTLVAVWVARYDRTVLVSPSEARAGMLRYAATLEPCSAHRAHVEDQAINGPVPANPQQRPTWMPQAVAS